MTVPPTAPSSSAAGGSIAAESLDRYGFMSRLCSLCNKMCRHACPTHKASKSETCSPHGRALIIELLRAGRKPALTSAAVEALYQCTLCGACKAWCKPAHDLAHIIQLARQHLVKNRRAPQVLAELERSAVEYGNVYGEPHHERFAALPPRLLQSQHNAQVIYFVGCTTAYRHPEIALATIQILERLGVTIHLLTGDDGERCCGSPLIRAGLVETARDLARRNVEAIKRTRIRTVITTCPGCARTLRLDYPSLGVPLPSRVRVLHITEFLAKRMRQLRPLIAQTSTKGGETASPAPTITVTYHDPCHLGRELGVYNQPRQLLKLLPGVRLIELQHNRDHADCCGAGGVLPKTFPTIASQIGQRRLDDAKQVGAQLIVSTCPNCKQFLAKTRRDTPNLPEPLDLMELLVSALS